MITEREKELFLKGFRPFNLLLMNSLSKEG